MTNIAEVWVPTLWLWGSHIPDSDHTVRGYRCLVCIQDVAVTCDMFKLRDITCIDTTLPHMHTHLNHYLRHTTQHRHHDVCNHNTGH